MQHATQVALTRRVIDFVDRSTTELAPALFLNPVSTYTCPRQAAREASAFSAARRCSSAFPASCRTPATSAPTT